ncbi:MAG: energy transducer TonB [Sphingomicrobium sp.]
MLAYAERRQRIGERASSPSTFLFIVGVHVAAVAVAMSMKMVVDGPTTKPNTDVFWVDPVKPPPPPPPTTDTSKPSQSSVTRTDPIVPARPSDNQVFDTRPTPFIPIGPLAGNELKIPQMPPARPIIVEPVRAGPRLDTPEWALKPPYPRSKLDSQQEASLRLQLSIDERGRVTAVEPVGSVDRAFFEAARKHLIARWRYRPATVDGSAVASSTTITLRFELEG